MSSDWDDELDRLQRQLELIRARVDLTASAKSKLIVPTVAEFVLGPGYLAQHKLYPKQLTLLRAIFCEIEGLTDYDHQVLEDWGRGFEKRPLEPGATTWMYEPAKDVDFTMGTTPDVLDRMRQNRAAGRRWFREANLVLGRRGGKGHVGALTCARLVWELLALGDPQAHFGIPRTKRISIPIFAGNREQARFNLFADIAGTIIDAPCFAPFIQHLYRDKLIIATPADLTRPDRIHEGSIEIVAKEATSTAGRGPATIAQFYDEMAFVDPATSHASAEDLYDAATPALDQFGEWAMVAELSSPHQQTGEFFAIHCRARELDPKTGDALYPELISFQLPSWEPYEDSDRAEQIPMVTQAEADANPAMADDDGRPRCFPPTGRPISANDRQMAQLQRAKRKKFRVERLAQWGTSVSAYFEPDDIETIFAAYKGSILRPTSQPPHSTSHVIAVDPGIKHDAFTWMIGHLDPVDELGRPHLIVDGSRRWSPEDHGGELDIALVLDALVEDIILFRASQVITDQYGGPFVVQDLRRRLQGTAINPFSVVREQAWTQGSKLAAAAAFAEAIALGQIHSPPDPQLRRELLFLEQNGSRIAAPTSGPVQSDDHAMAALLLTLELLGSAASQPMHQAFASQSLHAMRGVTATPEDRAVHDLMSPGRQGPRPARPGERSYPGGPKALPWRMR